MEQILETEGLEGRALTWQQLGLEADINASWRTIQKAMRSLDYYKCIACQRGWQSPASMENRCEFARIMLERYP